MANETLPLLALFDDLRLQADLPLGVEEYLLMVRALQSGFGLQDRQELYRLCCLLWTNSLQEQKVLRYYFDQHYPAGSALDEPPAAGESTGTDLDAARQAGPPAGETSPAEAAAALAQSQQAASAAGSTDAGLPPADAAASPPALAASMPEGTRLERGLAPLPAARSDLPLDESKATLSLLSMLSEPAAPARQFVLTGEYLPVTRRQMKQAWRHLRSLIREGPKTVLNVRATVDKIAYAGFLADLVLEPHRINRMELLLLVDRKGSMAPFHLLADRLVESAQKGGRLGQAGVYYFNNLPLNFLFVTPALIKAQPLEATLNRLRSERTVALIFSDAGAARGHQSAQRVELTARFIDLLKRHVRHVAWMNPMPHKRWKGTSAAEIARLAPMLEFSSRGMDEAIDVLRGRPRALMEEED